MFFFLLQLLSYGGKLRYTIKSGGNNARNNLKPSKRIHKRRIRSLKDIIRNGKEDIETMNDEIFFRGGSGMEPSLLGSSSRPAGDGPVQESLYDSFTKINDIRGEMTSLPTWTKPTPGSEPVNVDKTEISLKTKHDEVSKKKDSFLSPSSLIPPTLGSDASSIAINEARSTTQAFENDIGSYYGRSSASSVGSSEEKINTKVSAKGISFGVPSVGHISSNTTIATRPEVGVIKSNPTSSAVYFNITEEARNRITKWPNASSTVESKIDIAMPSKRMDRQSGATIGQKTTEIMDSTKGELETNYIAPLVEMSSDFDKMDLTSSEGIIAEKTRSESVPALSVPLYAETERTNPSPKRKPRTHPKSITPPTVTHKKRYTSSSLRIISPRNVDSSSVNSRTPSYHERSSAVPPTESETLKMNSSNTDDGAPITTSLAAAPWTSKPLTSMSGTLLINVSLSFLSGKVKEVQ